MEKQTDLRTYPNIYLQA